METTEEKIMGRFLEKHLRMKKKEVLEKNDILSL